MPITRLPEPADGQALRLVQITDCHLFREASARMRGVITRRSMQRVLQAMAAEVQRCHAVLATGDLAQDESEGAYHAFAELLAPLQRPVLCIPGNHDDPGHMASHLSGDGFQTGGAATGGNWLLIMLSSHWPGRTGGRLAESELQRLDTLLGSHPQHHVLVCLHHQPVPVGCKWLDRIGLDNAQDFLVRLDRANTVRGVLCGHVHQASEAQRNGALIMTSPSTCHQFTPGSDDYAEDGRPPGFRVLALYPDGRIETQVHWVAGTAEGDWR